MPHNKQPFINNYDTNQRKNIDDCLIKKRSEKLNDYEMEEE